MATVRRRPQSRPTTPLRRVSRGSLSQLSASRNPDDPYPLDSLEPAFADFADSLVDLTTNMEQLQQMQSNLAKFNESFASFLYGMNMNAFCVDFPEVSEEDVIFSMPLKRGVTGAGA